jgi:hypothetical protein
VPEADALLAVAPAQIDHLPIALGGEIDQAGVEVLDLDVERANRLHAALDAFKLFDDAPGIGVAAVGGGLLEHGPERRLDGLDAFARGVDLGEERAELGYQRISLGDGEEVHGEGGERVRG